MDSEPLRKLQDLLVKVNYNQVQRQDHFEIYQFVEQEVLSPKSSIIKQVPPLEVIAHSVRNIISPNLATRRIPHLLDLLATVEFYRKHTLDHAEASIVWNDYYKSTNTPINLSSEHELFLKVLESEQGSLRKIYINILTTCCHLDMYLLWVASPPSVTDVMIRFNEYFPFLNDYCNKKSPRLFHFDLSDAEISQLRFIGLAFCNFAQETIDWAMEHSEEGQPISLAFNTEEFQNTFVRPCGDRELSDLIVFFINYVTSKAVGFQDIINNDS